MLWLTVNFSCNIKNTDSSQVFSRHLPSSAKFCQGWRLISPHRRIYPALGGDIHFENLAQEHRAGFEPGLLDVKSIASVEKPLRLRASAVNAVS